MRGEIGMHPMEGLSQLDFTEMIVKTMRDPDMVGIGLSSDVNGCIPYFRHFKGRGLLMVLADANYNVMAADWILKTEKLRQLIEESTKKEVDLLLQRLTANSAYRNLDGQGGVDHADSGE